MTGAWVYFMTNRRNGTLYCGVTSNLPRCAWEHREGLIDGFTKEHALKKLVYYEHHDSMPFSARRISSTGRAPGRCGSSMRWIHSGRISTIRWS